MYTLQKVSQVSLLHVVEPYHGTTTCNTIIEQPPETHTDTLTASEYAPLTLQSVI